MNEEEFKEKNRDLFESWVADLVASGFGVLFIALSFAIDLNWRGRFVLFILGVVAQIPLFYYKLYRYFFPKKKE